MLTPKPQKHMKSQCLLMPFISVVPSFWCSAIQTLIANNFLSVERIFCNHYFRVCCLPTIFLFFVFFVSNSFFFICGCFLFFLIPGSFLLGIDSEASPFSLVFKDDVALSFCLDVSSWGIDYHLGLAFSMWSVISLCLLFKHSSLVFNSLLF